MATKDEIAADTVTSVLELDEGLRLALSSRDFDTIAGLYAPEFMLNGPAGQVQTREETIGLLRTTTARQSDVERTIEAAYAVGDVVVIMGYESLVWEDTGSERDGKRTARRFTNVWQRGEGGWRHIARQATTIPVDASSKNPPNR